MKDSTNQYKKIKNFLVDLICKNFPNDQYYKNILELFKEIKQNFDDLTFSLHNIDTDINRMEIKLVTSNIEDKLKFVKYFEDWQNKSKMNLEKIVYPTTTQETSFYFFIPF